MSVSEPVPEYKVSVVREAIEAALDYIEFVDSRFVDQGYPWPDCYDLLRAAWLSLEKCAVCGREGVICQLLDYEDLPEPEDLCADCRPIAHYAGLGKYEHEVYPF